MIISVALSYFHTIIGPSIFFYYPKDSLDTDLSTKIANIMNLVYDEGLFTHSIENLKSINYYFEIDSAWSSENTEWLMVSTILDQQVSPEIEEKISELCAEFSHRLQSNEEIFTAFYMNDINSHEDDKELIIKNEALIKVLVNSLYWAIAEYTRDEPIVLLMVGEGGTLIFSHNFIEDLQFEDEMLGNFLSAFNSFSDELFSEGLDRAKFGAYSVLMETVSNFTVCYLFKGQIYLAQQKLSHFAEQIQKEASILQTLNKFHKTSQVVEPKDIPFLETLITEIFCYKIERLQEFID